MQSISMVLIELQWLRLLVGMAHGMLNGIPERLQLDSRT